ncbi:MAG: hypothetical protein EOP83_19045 [Verrucomicrobiaceae bacterium]|nr:MAG: hypothetical protein EOP83_19045 [Verrucomicrobiaceae bacterium]
MKPTHEMRYDMLRWDPHPTRPGWRVMKVNQEIEAWIAQTGVQARLRFDFNLSNHTFLEFETEADAVAFKMRWL